jgi:hypothetical protein
MLGLASALPGPAAKAQESGVALAPTGWGASLEESANALDTALAITNLGTEPALDVEIMSIDLDGAPPILPLPLPESELGDIEPGAGVDVYANFSGSFMSDTPLVLTVQLAYTDPRLGRKMQRVKQGIAATRKPTIPTRRGRAPGARATRRLPPMPVGRPPGEVNARSVWQVPLEQIPAPPPKQPTQTSVEPLPKAGGKIKVLASVDFTGTAKGDGMWPREPSGAVAPEQGKRPEVVFSTRNTKAIFSIGGAAPVEVEPTTLFPQDDGGLCCDQIVQYVPKIDRFIWLIQYKPKARVNRMRIAAASPKDIIDTKDKGLVGAWTFWDLTCKDFKYTLCDLDYPDLAVGDNFLYASFDAKPPGNLAPDARVGLLVVRITLASIEKGGMIDFAFAEPARQAYFGHLSQETGDTAFWAGHLSNSMLRVFSWAETDEKAASMDVPIGSWPANPRGLTARTADGMDWLTGARDRQFLAVIGLTRNEANGADELWLAWHSPRGQAGKGFPIFPRPHIQLVKLDAATLKVLDQFQIWSDEFAFAYPALTTDYDGHIGLSLETGASDKDNYENHAVGFWSDFVVYKTATSDHGASRFGDYVTIRPDGEGGLAAFGYGLKAAGNTANPDIRYVDFKHP